MHVNAALEAKLRILLTFIQTSWWNFAWKSLNLDLNMTYFKF